MVAEADESDGAFLVYEPEGAIVTNVDVDHLDIWGDRGGLRRGVRRLRRHGRAVRRRSASTTRVRVHWSPSPAAAGSRWSPRVWPRTPTSGPPTSWCEADRTTFSRPARRRRRWSTSTLAVPGAHYAQDALAGAGRRPRPRAGRRGAGRGPVDLRRREPPHGASRRRRRRPGLRLLRPPPHRDPGRSRGRPRARRRRTARRGVPAAPRQPHPRVRRRDGARALGRRPRVSWPTSTSPGRIPTRPSRRSSWSTRSTDRRPRLGGPVETLAALLVPELRPGDLLLTLGAGDITTVGPAGARPCWRRRDAERAVRSSVAGPRRWRRVRRVLLGPARGRARRRRSCGWSGSRACWRSTGSRSRARRRSSRRTSARRPTVRLGEPLARVDTVAIESRVAAMERIDQVDGLASVAAARSASRWSSASRSPGCCPAARSARSTATASTSARCAREPKHLARGPDRDGRRRASASRRWRRAAAVVALLADGGPGAAEEGAVRSGGLQGLDPAACSARTAPSRGGARPRASRS